MTACCAILNIGVEISKYEEFYHEDDTVNRTAEGLKWIHLKEANAFVTG